LTHFLTRGLPPGLPRAETHPTPKADRRLPIGAEPTRGGGASFRVWAPRRRHVWVVIEASSGDTRTEPLRSDDDGYFSALIDDVPVGSLYHYRLADDERLYPDPASRFQPSGPHGPSQLVDPSAFQWTDGKWAGVTLLGQILYEMHVGTFTREGTWAAAAAELPRLAELGVSVLEVMPVADFPGAFGWGYDGVNLFAPTRLYGSPDDFRYFVDSAHAMGIAVILDVVYNHFGPDGNYLAQFAHEYFTDRYENEWGDAINFDGPGSGPVREFILANAGYWIDEFHLDGLRLDATQQIFDASEEHITAAIVRRVRQAAHPRHSIVVAENEPQDVRLIRKTSDDGFGVDCLWNDDFHHTAVVALTGRREAYYSPYYGTPQELISTTKRAFLYQGQWYNWQRQGRGTPTFGLPHEAFVSYIENHDQVANSGRGTRLRQLSSPGRYRAITTLLLVGPATPMLFQGQEYGSTRPFVYFADHEPDLARAIAQGRAKFLSQFPSLAEPEMQRQLADPSDAASFEASKLDSGEMRADREVYALHRDLIRLRRGDPVLALQGAAGIDGAVLGDSALVIRFFSAAGEDDHLLLMNLGAAWELEVSPEPLLAPPAGRVWQTLWSSEDPRYGGSGTPTVCHEGGWWLPAESAVLLAPAEAAPGAVWDSFIEQSQEGG
jgi:maltooligosyltrehalose trehalohydrolase